MYISFVWFILFEKLKSQSHLITAIHKLKPIHQLGYNVYFMQKINDSFRTVYSFSLNKNQRVKCTRDLLCSTRGGTWIKSVKPVKKEFKKMCALLCPSLNIDISCVRFKRDFTLANEYMRRKHFRQSFMNCSI